MKTKRTLTESLAHWLSQGANIPSIEQIVIFGLSTFIQLKGRLVLNILSLKTYSDRHPVKAPLSVPWEAEEAKQICYLYATTRSDPVD